MLYDFSLTTTYQVKAFYNLRGLQFNVGYLFKMKDSQSLKKILLGKLVHFVKKKISIARIVESIRADVKSIFFKFDNSRKELNHFCDQP